MSSELVETGWQRFLDRLKQLWGKSRNSDLPTTAIGTGPFVCVSVQIRSGRTRIVSLVRDRSDAARFAVEWDPRRTRRDVI